jgi:hypothetical protein
MRRLFVCGSNGRSPCFDEIAAPNRAQQPHYFNYFNPFQFLVTSICHRVIAFISSDASIADALLH